MSHTKVKICCIKSIDEAERAITYGAYALGLVGPMPSGPGVIDLQVAHEIADFVRGRAETFLLTSRITAREILLEFNEVQPSTLQLVDHVPFRELKELRRAVADVNIVQVIHVIDERSIKEALDVSPYVDRILLDSGNPNASIKELGGTGRIHDWTLSKTIVASCPVPVYLAGGLNADNVQDAICRVRPFGLDLCSGVRSNRQLDEDKLSAFFTSVNEVKL